MEVRRIRDEVTRSIRTGAGISAPQALRLLLVCCCAVHFAGASASESIHAGGSTTHLVIGDVPTRDTSKPIYEVHLPPLGGHAPNPEQGLSFGASGLENGYPRANSGRPAELYGEPVRMVTARGQVLTCGVPTPVPEPGRHSTSSRSKNGKTDESASDANKEQGRDNDVGGNSAPGVADSQNEDVDTDHGWAGDVDFSDVDELLAEYRGKCFQREEGWWAYTFCYGRSVEQRHSAVQPDEEEALFVLGELDTDYDEERRKDPSRVSTRDSPYTQLYGNGTRCDVNGRLREIVVQYRCNLEAVQVGGVDAASLNFISAVREVESCVYVVDFVNDAICRHPAYRRQLERNVLPINCFMDAGEGEFLGLASTDYRKASLNL